MSDYRRYVGRRVLVNLAGDLTMTGTLEAAGKELLTLVDAHGAALGREPRPVDGVALLPLASVHWVQVP